ncbi:MAG: chromosomal replication initiator protein DnaA [Waddliaceae bacterium]|nr:chromosomal replication initiator protein DnaA [Waddliaceae bacterium]
MQAWEDFLVLQDKELGSNVVNKWLRPLKILHFDACNLYLEARDAFQVMWFEEHIRSKATTKFVNANKKRIKVHLSISSAESNASDSAQDKKERRYTKKQASHEAPPVFTFSHNDLDPYCTFDNFISSEQNLLSYKLLTQLVGYHPDGDASEAPQIDMTTYNPVYLYGGAGVGKTHLLMAMAHCLKDAGLNVLYSKAETFTDNVVRAIRAGEMQTFRRLYRAIDVLIVDDVQIFSGKSATQEEFFHTFNTLQIDDKPIILSADCPPSELKAVEPRLVSRFEWGITLGIENPARDTIQNILSSKALTMNYPLSDKVVAFLLDTFSSSTQSLIRALEALVLRTHLEQTSGKKPPALPLDVTTAQRYLGELIQQEKHASITPTKILHAVAEHYGIKVEDILSKSQNREVTFPRQLAMHLCRKQLKMPYMKIGGVFSRDPSTVMSSVKQIQKNLDDKDKETLSANQSALRKLKA